MEAEPHIERRASKFLDLSNKKNAIVEIRELKRSWNACAKGQSTTTVTAAFWQMGKGSKGDTTIRGLSNGQRVERKTPRIVEVVRSYYENLFAWQETNESCHDRALRAIPKVDCISLMDPVTTREVLLASNDWKKGKTPGPDGLPYELFLVFLNKDLGLTHKLLDAIAAIATVLIQYHLYETKVP